MTGKANSEWREEWKTLDGGLRTGRYTDPDFTRLEYEKLWGEVWQFACRVDEVPNVGDYTTYDIGEQSAMIVRVDENTIQAFNNACPHRGTTLSDGSGSFERNRIMCPFHGWKWDLDGSCNYVLERQEFNKGQLQLSDVNLRQVHTQVYAGFVFVSFSDNPQDFNEFIAPVRGHIDALRIGDMHHRWWRRVEGPCNWKVAQEAFFEAFHVPTTHPQLDEPGRKTIYEDMPETTFQHWDVSYEGLEGGHGRFFAASKVISDTKSKPTAETLESMIEHMEHLIDELDTMVLPEDVEVAKSLRGLQVAEGSSWGAEFIKAVYAQATAQGRPMPDLTPDIAAQWGGEVFVFPNLLILPNMGNSMIYRIRPLGDSPDQCIFEIFSVKTLPADEEPARAECTLVTDANDPEQLLLIPRQDFGNVPRIQKGLHTKGLKQVWLAGHQEVIIQNMHQWLDRYLGAPGAFEA
ncbi:aromatic ring-hydroxylating oxygenase subunit alpha [Halioxenophilus sp. WMMB6]|uniref:aromatic ring-hydroxylating oxygenase subunit alpha n=1 Tax=Halioxenophilus sp. WMMB6 TaxID=3073815 RepID=UPI00295E8F2D|nr:SRPBCC family protein [Halioxenophilus sp. WMMB6]